MKTFKDIVEGDPFDIITEHSKVSFIKIPLEDGKNIRCMGNGTDGTYITGNYYFMLWDQEVMG